MASGLTNRAKTDFLKGTHDWTSGTFKIMLVQSGYTFDPDHNFVSSITSGTNYELNSSGSGSGYTAGFSSASRKTLASCTVTQDDTNDKAKADANDPSTWTALNCGTIGGLAIYRSRTTDADSEFICFIDILDVTTNGGDFAFAFSANGVFRW